MTPPSTTREARMTMPTTTRDVRCGNPDCPSARYGRPALICIIEAPPKTPIAVRTRCRRCKTWQRIHLPNTP